MDALTNALIRRIRLASKIADQFHANDSPESAAMWEETYSQLMAVFYDLVEAKGDHWDKLIRNLERELDRE